MLDKKHIELFCDVMQISADKIKNIHINPGRSANNSNYVFVVDNYSYLYRLPGAGTEKFSNRTIEAQAYLMLSPYKITDEVIYLSEDSGIKISKYYEQSRIPNDRNIDELRETMKTLKRLYELGIDFPLADNLFERMNRYRTFAYEAGGGKFYLEGFDNFLKVVDEFQEYLQNANTKQCFCHGDVSINNVLITKEYDYPILIDMEFPAMADPIGDVATFCVDADYREKDILLMLDLYLDRKATLNEQYHVFGLCIVTAMMWYSWAA